MSVRLELTSIGQDPQKRSIINGQTRFTRWVGLTARANEVELRGATFMGVENVVNHVTSR
jgi:hypothetical protein